MVSFSSASFPLCEESVGLALQSCIGGTSKDFRVFKLADRRFRFSVASNHVGHFIYGLRDRIWPDFICHFSLFRGVHPSISGFHHDIAWNSSSEILAVSKRSPTAFRPNLEFLKIFFAMDRSAVKELAKFDFDNTDIRDDKHASAPMIKFGSLDPTTSSSASIFNSDRDGFIFGSFAEPVIPDLNFDGKGSFIPKQFS